MNITLTDTEARTAVDALAVRIASLDALIVAGHRMPTIVQMREAAAELHVRIKAELGEAHALAHIEAARKVA